MKNSYFGCTAYNWHEIKHIDCEAFKKLFNENLHLPDYGKDIENIIVAFVAMTERGLLVIGGIKPTRFSVKNKEIIGDILLDFQAMMNAQSPEESRQIQAEGYLKFLDSLKHHRSLRKADFNAQKLYEDTKNLFEREGWVKEVEVKI